MTRPCKDCPFRSDRLFILSKLHVARILRSLDRSSFPCHNTVEYDDYSGEAIVGQDTQHCAGAAILQEKVGRPSQMLRIAERLGVYDRTKLDLASPVYESFEAMIAAQPFDR